MSNHEKRPISDDDFTEEVEDEAETDEAELERKGSGETGNVDLSALAEKVYQRLRREVLIERERQSGRRSG
jgi:hypothetical protein